MNLTPLYDVKERLEHAAIAGTGLIAEDFRLKRAIDGLSPLAAASPVFAKIKAGGDELLTAPAEERAAKLLDLLGLVDAVAYTQGAAGRQGDLSPLPQGGGTYVHASYCQLQPLITALTGTASGRMTVIQDAWDNHPDYFTDFRVLPHVVAALGNTYSELADLAEKILAAQGTSVIPLLKKDFAPDGKKEMMRRVRLIAQLAGAQENEWFRAVLPHSKKNVREMLITVLSLSQDNTQLLLDLSRSERGNLKKTAQQSLVCMNSPEARAFWEAEAQKNPALVWELRGVNSPLAADLVARAVRELLEKLPNKSELEPQDYDPLRSCLYALHGQSSDATRELWRWLAPQIASFDRYHPPTNRKYQNCTVAEFLQKCLTETVLWNPCPETFALAREMSRLNPDWFLGAEFVVDLMELPPAEVYDKYAHYLKDNETAATEMARISILQGFTALQYHKGGYRFAFYKDDWYQDGAVPAQIPINGLDPRWAALITDPKVYKGVKICDISAGWSERKEQVNMDLMAADLLDPNAPELCAAFGEYYYRRTHQTGDITYYYKWLMQCGWTKWRGLLVHCAKLEGEAMWALVVENILTKLPISGPEKAAELREINELVQNRKIEARYNVWPSTEAKMLIAQWEAESTN